MKHLTFLSTLLLFVFIQFAAGQIPRTISYQGVLTDASGAPVPDGNYPLHFRLYQSPIGGSPIWMENQTVAVTDGIFNVTLGSLNPLTLPFNTAYWLGVTVPPGPELTPRTPLTSTPYSLSSGGGGGGWSDDGSVVRLTTVTDSVGIGTADPTEKLEVNGNLNLLDTLFFGSDEAMIHRPGGELVIETDDMPIRIHNDPAMYIDHHVYVNSTVEMTGFKMPTGAANQYVLTSNATGQGTWQPAAAVGNAWSLTGNSGAAPPTNFLGTTDLQPFEIKVNNSRVFRFEPGSENAPNLIGGSSTNNVASGVKGATIGGGGGGNSVGAEYGTISGGADNHIIGRFGAVGGGKDVSIEGDFAAVGGGFVNFAGGRAAAIAGGEENDAAGSHSAVGGGFSNDAWGAYATVPGGYSNTALGKYSFAAGNHARANHDGCFVWADSIQEEFASTAPSQFLIRASGGVGIGTANPQGRLHVNVESGSAVPFVVSRGEGDRLFEIQKTPNDAGKVVIYDDDEDADIVFNTRGDSYIRWNNFGVGTAAPQTLLANTDDDGTGAVPNDDALVWKSTGESFAAIINNEGSGNGVRIETNPGTAVRTFETSNGLGYGLFVDGNNNVSVGMTGGWTNRFSVNGAVAVGFSFAGQTAPANGMIVEGKVGIGTSGVNNILTVQQNSASDPIADAWTTYSSRRWKTNIRPIESAMEKIRRLRGVRFDWKESGKPDIGLIAEEVGEVIPEVVAYEENGIDAKSVDYARLVAVLIEGMKEQQRQIEELKAVIQTLAAEKAQEAGKSASTEQSATLPK